MNSRLLILSMLYSHFRIKVRRFDGFVTFKVIPFALQMIIPPGFLDDSKIDMSAVEISVLTALVHLERLERMKPFAEKLGRNAKTVSRPAEGFIEVG